MKTRKSVNYLRSYRLRWGLSQGELAYLLGWSRPEVISRVEKKQRAPTLRLVIGCFILFGAAPADLFPDISEGVETEVIARVWEFYERVQGDLSRKTKKQIDLLEDAIERAKQRGRQSHP